MPEPRREAEALLEAALGGGRAALLAGLERPLVPPDLGRFARLLRQRARRVPLQYLLGEWDFYGRRFFVDRRVLIPRPETELLVEQVLKQLLGEAGGVVVDVGTGSGVIAVSLGLERADLDLIAVDRSAAALDQARHNAAAHGVLQRIVWLQGNLLQPLEAVATEGSLAAVVSNPPYVSSGEYETLEPEVREHEPRAALVAGESGLEVILELVRSAPRWLRPSGLLAVELGHRHAPAVREVVERIGDYGWCEFRHDLAGIERVLLARRTG